MRAGKKCTKRHRHARKRCRRHAPAALSISPQGKDFGTIGTADGSPADFVVTNRGDLRSGIPAPSLSGSGISHFTISGTTCVSPLARHGTCTVTVQSIHNDGATAMAQLNVGATPGGNTSALLIVNIY